MTCEILAGKTCVARIATTVDSTILIFTTRSFSLQHDDVWPARAKAGQASAVAVRRKMDREDDDPSHRHQCRDKGISAQIVPRIASILMDGHGTRAIQHYAGHRSIASEAIFIRAVASTPPFH